MTDNEAHPKRTRRILLKGLAGSGATAAAIKMLPATWTRPVVDSVTLPAHAATSVTLNGDFSGSAPAQIAGVDNRLIDAFISSAVANNVEVRVCLIGVVDNLVAEVLISIGGDNGARQNVPLPFSLDLSGSFSTSGYENAHATGNINGGQVEGRVTFTNTNIHADEFADYVATPGECPIED